MLVEVPNVLQAFGQFLKSERRDLCLLFPSELLILVLDLHLLVVLPALLNELVHLVCRDVLELSLALHS